ncbi:MAG: hypothetical protein AB7O84_24730, partial [Planctomycetota bacterium]
MDSGVDGRGWVPGLLLVAALVGGAVGWWARGGAAAPGAESTAPHARPSAGEDAPQRPGDTSAERRSAEIDRTPLPDADPVGEA